MAIIKLDGGYNALPISYKRGNPIPLDTTAVWYDFAELTTYAKTGVTAYVGQVLTYVDAENNTATAYVIANVAGDLEPIGTVPTGDGKTISVTDEGQISILVATDSDKDAGSVLTLQSDGTMKWVKPDNTTVEGLNLSVNALKKEVFGVEADEEKGVEEYIGIVDRVDVLEDASADYADRLEAIESDYLKEADKYDDTALAARVKAIEDDYLKEEDKYDDSALAQRVTDLENGKADKATTLAGYGITDAYTKTEVDGAIDDAVKGLLGDDIDEAYNTLKEIQDILEGTDGETIDGLIEVAADNKAKIEVLNGGANVAGSVDAKIAAAVAPLATTEALNGVKATAEAAQTADEVSAAIEAAFTEANLAQYAVAETVNAALGLKANAADVVANTTFEEFKTANTQAIADAVSEHDTAVAGTYATKAEMIDLGTEIGNTYATKATTYTKDEIDGKKFVDETALATTLTGYQTVAPEGKTYAYTSDIESAVTNLTNGAIQEAKNAAIEANTAASNAQNTANEAKAAAAVNAEAITALNSTTSANTTKLNQHSTAIGTIEGTINTHGSDIESLKGRVTNNETAIAKKAEQSDLTALDGRVVATENAINTLNTVTIPAVNAEIEKKANATAVYTKEEVNAIVGANKPADKTIMDLIADAQAAATYDDTAVKKLISDEAARADAAEKANAKAIADEAARADAAEKVNAKAIADEAIRAKAAEEELAGDIADLDNAIKAVLDNEGGALDSIKELATWVEEHETEVLPVIEQHGKDIKAIYTPAEGETAASGVLVTEIARVEDEINDLKAVDHAAAHAATLKDAKDYADGLADNYATAAQGAKADTAIQSVTCEADMGIKAVQTGTGIVLSWDDNVTFVFNGGNSTGWNN